MRFIRIAVMAGDTPHAVDMGVQGPGKIIVNNVGATDIYIGQDRSDVIAATASQFLTLSAGVMLVFDVSDMVGYVGQRQMLWFNSPVGAGALEVAFLGVE